MIGAARPRLRRLLPGPIARWLEADRVTTLVLLAIRATALGLTFVTGIVIARLYGADGYGFYSFGMSVVSLLVVPASLGFDQLLIREIATLTAQGERARLAKLLGFILFAVTTLAAAVSLLTLLAVQLFTAGDWVYATVVTLMLPSVLFLSCNKLTDGILLGAHRPIPASLGQQLVRPLLLIVAVVVFAQGLVPPAEPDAQLGLAASLSLGAAALASALFARPFLRHHLGGGAGAKASPGPWTAAAVAFALIQGAFLLRQNIDVLMLGFVSTPDQAGICRAAQRLAELVIVVENVLSTQFRSRYAAAHADGDAAGLEGTARSASRLALAGALPVLVVYALAGAPLLTLFGEAFAAGDVALIIFSLGQLSSVLVGHSIFLLAMCGHARLAAGTMTAGLAVNVAANLWLAPTYGALGASIANATSITLTNIVVLLIVRRKLGVNPCILLPALRRRSEA